MNVLYQEISIFVLGLRCTIQSYLIQKRIHASMGRFTTDIYDLRVRDYNKIVLT